MKYTIEQMEDFQWLVQRETDFGHTIMGAARSISDLPRVMIGDDVEVYRKEYPEYNFIARQLMGLAKGSDGQFRAIETIKAIRGITGCGLKEAKDAYDTEKAKHYG